jgi:HEXXH motif-containing protein
MSSRSATAVEGHRVSTLLLDETFAGPVSASTMAALRAGQYSRQLVLLKAVRELTTDAADSWRSLVAADQRAPDVVREVLTYPAVGTWLVRTISKARGIVSDDVPVAAELDYLGSVAAAAAIRAGIPAVIDVPVWHGRFSLPTIGQFETGDDTVRRVRVRHSDAGTHVDDVPLEELPALPLRRHRSAVAGVEVWWTIDDIDPYRGFSTTDHPARLSQPEYAHWCALLDGAWAILVRQHADYAAELAHVGPVIVPMSPSGGLVASSSSSSFGAIIVATPDTVADLAEILVHELQHSKLNAVLDLVRLTEGTSPLCYAPWRADPRPLPSLLHGIYAFTTVTEYWRRQRRADANSHRATFKFLYHREQVRRALRAVTGAPGLTAFGTRLVDAVRTRVAACDTEDVPDEFAGTVALLLTVHWLSWRLRHLTPPADHVAESARRWLAGDEPPRRHDSVLAPDSRPEHGTSLPVSLRAKALDPDQFTVLAVDPGERALADGRRDEAARAFATRIVANPDDDGAWVGLVAATDEDVPVETLSATYRRLAATGHAAPDPVTLAVWFADGTMPG